MTSLSWACTSAAALGRSDGAVGLQRAQVLRWDVLVVERDDVAVRGQLAQRGQVGVQAGRGLRRDQGGAGVRRLAEHPQAQAQRGRRGEHHPGQLPGADDADQREPARGGGRRPATVGSVGLTHDGEPSRRAAPSRRGYPDHRAGSPGSASLPDRQPRSEPSLSPVSSMIDRARGAMDVVVREMIKFGAVGAVAFVVDVGVFNLLRFGLGDGGPLEAKPITAKVISATCATVVAWLGQPALDLPAPRPAARPPTSSRCSWRST